MKILSIECSAKSASCAIVSEDKIIGSSFINVGLTHSQTLLPAVSNLLSNTRTDIKEINAFAISAGPGSFTGIRIGISAVKGMALCNNVPCISVSTLYAIAQNFRDRDAVVCAVMDARCKQLYAALFRVKDGKVKRLCEDKAVKSEDFAKEIMRLRYKCPIIIAGDGAEVFFPFVQRRKNIILADLSLRLQNGIGVGLAAIEEYEKGNTVTAEKLLPIYLRLPQAERELKEKQRREK